MSKPASDQPRSDFAGNPGVIATTLLSGVIAVAVAAAEWVGSGKALDSPAGILWAVVAQLGLAAHDWPPGLPVRVRMGLHTGEGVLGDDNYVGIDVNRAARIAGAAHGGQVIVSGATRSLVEQALPEGTALRDLGEHRLKDLNLPIHLNDLVVEGLAADFRPPRTLDARPGNLPAPLTSFIGREREIAEIRRLLGRARLITLTGAGGSGQVPAGPSGRRRARGRVPRRRLPRGAVLGHRPCPGPLGDGAGPARPRGARGPTPARAKALAGDPAGIAQALYNQGFVVAADGAFGLFEESRELARRAGDEPAAARTEWMLAIRDLAAGAWERPVAIAEQAVATWRRIGDRLQMGDGLVWLAVVYARAGRQADARSAIGEALRLFREVDSPVGIVSVILGLSYLARWEGRYQDAVRLAGAAESLCDQVGARPPLGFLAGFVGDPEAEARARLPGDAAEAAWEEGRRLSVDAALAPAAVPPAS